MKLRILIADDHEVVREGTRSLLAQEHGWEICGMAANGREAVALAQELKPDVVVLDLSMPEMNGLEAARQIKRAVPEIEIVAFSAHSSEEIVVQMFEAGAKSYVRKGDATQHLIAAVRSVAQHEPFFTPEISEILFARITSPSRGQRNGSEEAKLTPRELEITRLLAGGMSNKEVASTLGISVRTAETHRASLLQKLRMRSLADLTRYAIRNHIIEA